MLQVETVEKFLTAEHKVAPVANTSLIEIQIGPLAFLGRSIKHKMKPTYLAHPEFFLYLMFGSVDQHKVLWEDKLSLEVGSSPSVHPLLSAPSERYDKGLST